MASIDVKLDAARRPTFALRTPAFSYVLRVDADGDLVLDHFGAPASGDGARDAAQFETVGWARDQRRRELPDAGRGDMRLPGVHVVHAAGHSVSHFEYVDYWTAPGVPGGGDAGTHGGGGGLGVDLDADPDAARTLCITMADTRARLEATLTYTLLGAGAITRQVALRNVGAAEVRVERLASCATDLPPGEYDMVHHYGSWAREFQVARRRVEHGTQGFHSIAGYASHHYNPFVALVRPETTEESGDAWGFNLVYSGSFAVDVERDAQGTVRTLLGLHPLHLSWPLAPGETLTSPECIAAFSSGGLGGMSRAFHDVYRRHLCRSGWTLAPRPPLLNSWEATYFDFDEATLLPIAERAAGLGVGLFVMDDGWFGNRYPRVDDTAGLGDWVVNRARFKDGLGPFVDKVTALDVACAAGRGAPQKLRFGIWVEPEMVNPKSELYDAHPEWVLHAPGHARTEARHQLVLNLGLREVQDYIIASIGAVLASADISYVKWDNNRAMHELAHPADAHRYILGLYRVLGALTARFPHVLWEGCASGGGRLDPGLLAFWPQHWTSDNTDAVDRLHIQFGATLSYPPASLGCHVSAVPNHQTGRAAPLAFRAHVAMLGGGFGLELDPAGLSPAERAQIPALLALSAEINPLVVRGDLYRLALPGASNWPAALYVDRARRRAALLVFQVRDRVARDHMPLLRLRGLERETRYELRVFGGPAGGGSGADEDEPEVSEAGGEELMNVGVRWSLRGDCQSRVVLLAAKEEAASGLRVGASGLRVGASGLLAGD